MKLINLVGKTLSVATSIDNQDGKGLCNVPTCAVRCCCKLYKRERYLCKRLEPRHPKYLQIEASAAFAGGDFKATMRTTQSKAIGHSEKLRLVNKCEVGSP